MGIGQSVEDIESVEVTVCDEKGLICWRTPNSIYVKKISRNDISRNNMKFDSIYQNGQNYYRYFHIDNNGEEDVELSKQEYDSLIDYYESLKWTKLNFMEIEELPQNVEDNKKSGIQESV